jgi:hypothetical protein
MRENSLIKQKNHAEIEGIEGRDTPGEGQIWALFALSSTTSSH